MAKPLLPDDLWELIEPLLPKRPPRPKGGRPPLDDRKALTGILFVLKTGIPWEYLPQEMGCGCGMTCWRRLKAWFLADIWETIHTTLLSQLRFLKKIDFSRFLIDTCHVRAVGGGAQTGPSPVDRAKLGSKIELITDAQGVLKEPEPRTPMRARSYSLPMCSPFSATERFISRTRRTRAADRAAHSQKTSK